MDTAIEDRVAQIDWPDVDHSLAEYGYARIHRILTPDECSNLRSLYAIDEHFRSSIIMDFPAEHADLLARCHRAGQKQATPLLLHYETGGSNCLHRDLYGEIAFPLQFVVMLGQQGRDWDGGEFILVENIPRAQSRAEVITVDQGCGVIFTTRDRPVKGTRGWYRTAMRHGVSRVSRGTRYTLGVIFHDAK